MRLAILLISFILLSGSAFGQGKGGQKRKIADSLFVRRTDWPATEKDELILLSRGKTTTVYTMYTADGSSIDYLFSFGNRARGYDCYGVYNNAGGGYSFLLFNRADKRLYITYGCYDSGFELIPGSVDLNKRTVRLENKWSPAENATDTLRAGSSTNFVGASAKIRIIEANLKPIDY